MSVQVWDGRKLNLVQTATSPASLWYTLHKEGLRVGRSCAQEARLVTIPKALESEVRGAGIIGFENIATALRVTHKKRRRRNGTTIQFFDHTKPSNALIEDAVTLLSYVYIDE